MSHDRSVAHEPPSPYDERHLPIVDDGEERYSINPSSRALICSAR